MSKIKSTYVINKKALGCALCVTLLVALITGRQKWLSLSPPRMMTIAITQIIEHPSLNQEREGIFRALAEAGYTEGKNIKVVYQNAQGSPVLAAQIAQKLVALQPSVIVAISTPSAQSILAARGNRNIPIVFTAVEDPVGARLIKDWDHPGTGITGVSDHLAATRQLKFVKDFLPNVLRIGVIYNPGENNSAKLWADLEKAAPEHHLRLSVATAGRTGEVVAAAQSLLGRVEALYIPNDNTAVSAIDGIIGVARQNHLPVFVGDLGSLRPGIVAATGYDRISLGRKAGEKVVQTLSQNQTEEIPVAHGGFVQIRFDAETVAHLGIQVPLAVKNSVMGAAR